MSRRQDLDTPKSPREGPPNGPDGPGADAGTAAEDRRSGPFELLFQEIVRRTTALGLSSFFTTEEAIRRAFNEAVPRDWVDYASRQSSEVRQELIDKLAQELGAYLRGIEPSQLVGKLLEDYEVTATIELSARPRKGQGGSLKVVRRGR